MVATNCQSRSRAGLVYLFKRAARLPGLRDLTVQADHVDAAFGKKPGVILQRVHALTCDVAIQRPKPDRFAITPHERGTVPRAPDETGFACSCFVQVGQIQQGRVGKHILLRAKIPSRVCLCNGRRGKQARE